MYLLDTNVVSELRKAKSGKADAGVIAWAAGLPASELFLSAISVLELEMGVPSERHEDVRDEQKPDGCKAFGEHVGQMLRS